MAGAGAFARARVVVLGFLIGVAGCVGRSEPAVDDATSRSARPAEPRVREVTVVRPARERLDAEVEVPGTVVPVEEAAVAAQGAGVVRRVHVDAGRRVARGEVLVELDPTKAALAVRQAEAALAQARATFDKTRSDLDRKRQLLDERTIAPGTYDAFKAQYDAAAAAVDAAETALRLARQRLADLTVVAPFAGLIKEKRVTPGEYVREGDVVAVLMRIDPIKLRFDIPEKYAGRIGPGQPVVAVVVAWPGEEFSGRVRTVFPAVAEATRTVRVDAEVANPAFRLKPGFFATVRVPIRTLATSLVLPRSALLRRDGTDHVYVVRDGRARLVRVATGAETADRIEIVTGLDADDQVVAADVDALTPDEPVRVRG